ncbi:hypothetical protein [Aquimarina litoralis]|uniref:hypothetical protein n=1 Tax=Aquimarina litoralis TaxID=584605 RepID=UPI001C5622C8|nr:hypothetical protein [Aquimarina litoralis]MBW1297003.1 hypothetical protein [Aquimarina litoralis]
MKKIKSYFLLLYMIFFLIGCNQSSSVPNRSEIVDPVSKTEDSIVANETSQGLNFKTSLDRLQGIWKGKKDLNQSIPYRIQFDKKVLDILCIEGICDEEGNDNSVLELSFLGFLNSSVDEILKKKDLYDSQSLLNDGSVMVRLLKNDILLDESFSFDSFFYTTKLTSSYMYDDELYNESSFIKIDALPKEIFVKLKQRSKLDKIDYLKDFKIKEQSKKIKVTTDKTFFHNEMSETSKRKAFLVKEDIAYMEDVNDDWVKVYYDGKIVSGGYVKRSDVEILK